MRYGQLIDMIAFHFKEFNIRYAWNKEYEHHQIFLSLPNRDKEMLVDARNIGLVKTDSPEFETFMDVMISNLKKISKEA